jgi:hypothetical protein
MPGQEMPSNRKHPKGPRKWPFCIDGYESCIALSDQLCTIVCPGNGDLNSLEKFMSQSNQQSDQSQSQNQGQGQQNQKPNQQEQRRDQGQQKHPNQQSDQQRKGM